MNIAIIDDEAPVHTEVKQIIEKYLLEHYPSQQIQITFSLFSSAEDFLEAFEPQKFQMIFMDIYMQEITGMEAAQKIRAAGDNTPIVFLTTSTEYLLEGYTVFASGYIVKPLADSLRSFLQILDHCLPTALDDLLKLEVVIDRIHTQIPFHNILYLEYANRTLSIHLDNRVLTATTSYKDCYDQLMTDPRFSECYHCLIVNMDSIARPLKEAFLLKDGTTIPISRRKHSEVKEAYIRHLISI